MSGSPFRPRSKRLIPTAASAAALSLFTAACQGPTSATQTGYAGEWKGTTAQGRAIAFTISSGEAVTSITVEHDFNGCAGAETFSGLNLSIAPNVTCIPGPCSPPLTSYRAFGFTSRTSLDAPATTVQGLFPSTTTAQGTVNFQDFPGCGNALGVGWSATRR